MSAWLMDGLREHGVDLSEDRCLELLNSDIKLNTQGIEYWLDHRDRRRSLCSGQGETGNRSRRCPGV
ncbi:MAG: hypothetical protein GY732_05970 [Gammaproteobacteria bacterium]|nr:hypothetical protein [Gammaproteobacteria bacterium]